MNNTQKPVLYTFRRCPYAMRARLAITISGQNVDSVEVDLKNKPPRLLQISPKGTVPVIELANGNVIEQSLDIMIWALSNNEPEGWMQNIDLKTHPLIVANDGEFKYFLDRYKYADRYPEHSVEYYRAKAEVFIQQLENLLSHATYLAGDKPTILDYAIFPFVRQFAHVDKLWFFQSHYKHVIHWLSLHIDSDLFNSIMRKTI